MLWIGFATLFTVIIVGSRLKGMSTGILGGLGLMILVFFFRVLPQEPPYKILLSILPVIIAVDAIEVAGGMHYLTYLAEKAIKKHPHYIIFISPLVTYLFVFLTGTGQIVYSILPIIVTVAKQVRIKPKRPLSLSIIAAFYAIISSPISASMSLIVSLLRPYGITVFFMFVILITSTIGGVFVATCIISLLHNKLDKNENEVVVSTIEDDLQKTTQREISHKARYSVFLFLIGIMLIIILNFEIFRPKWEVNGKIILLDSSYIIAMVMFSVAALIILLLRIKFSDMLQGKVFISGIHGIVSILGITWLSDSLIQANFESIKVLVINYLTNYWQFSIVMFMLVNIMGNISATIRTVIPLGLFLGIPPILLLAFLPAINPFFIPTAPIILAAINLDSTGTTRVGKFFLNHSFMLPGFIAMITAVTIAFGLTKYLL